MQSGIIKVIPPKEWLKALPDIAEKAKKIVIRNPIEQHINGAGGYFRQTNVVKKRTFSLLSWKKLCLRSDRQPPAKRGSLRRFSNDSSDTDDYKDEESLNFSKERISSLEKIYWKTLIYNSPLYGADMSGSLFDDTVKSWNVANLREPLNYLRSRIPGVNTPYLYFGMWKASFAWHREDVDLYSINFIHFGAPKYWYSISQCNLSKFEKLMKTTFSSDAQECPEFLRHKTFLASPNYLENHGIAVNRLVHYENEFVITFPYGYHSGFNLGYNCAESVNFATESWFKIGYASKKCMCISDAVSIDVYAIVRELSELGIDTSNYGIDFSKQEGLDQFSKRACNIALNKRKRAKALASKVIESNKSKSAKNKVKKKVEKEMKKSYKDIIYEPDYRCLFCPHYVSYEKLIPVAGIQEKKYVHLTCALLIPEVSVDYLQDQDGNREWKVTEVNRVNTERYKLKCSYCKSMKGACFQCSVPECICTYHGTCAARAGVWFECLNSSDETSQFRYLCRRHRPPSSPEELKLLFCSKLRTNVVVQGQTPSNDWFAGQIKCNNVSENTLILYSVDGDSMEVPYFWISNTYCDMSVHLQVLAALGMEKILGNRDALAIKRRKDVNALKALAPTQLDLPPDCPILV